MKYNNPVISGFYPDPSVCRVGEDYYLVTSSFAYFPGVPIWHSKDLIHWRQIGHCLTEESQLYLEESPASGGIYAPTIRYHMGRFYMTTTNTDKGGHFIVYADDPLGPWSSPIYVDQPGIDPSLYFDDDGKVYFTSTGAVQSIGVYQCEIDITTGRKLSETQLIWKGTGGAFPEAPHLYKINGYYYLMCAEGGTEYGHMVTICRGESPYGPFETCPYNPILSHRSLHREIHATGHADLIQTHDGNWWAVFLGIRPVSYPYRHHIGRETFLAPVTWTADGWPIIGNNGTVELEMEAETLPFVPWEDEPEKDDFDQLELGLKWNFIRSPRHVNWSLNERRGWLAIRGSETTLSDHLGVPSFIGCRQTDLQCDVSTRLEFQPHEDGEEAGLAIYMNEEYHYEIALSSMEGNRALVVRKRAGSLIASPILLPCEESIVELRIHATPQRYFFYCKFDGQEEWQLLGEAETHLLSTEVAGGFTGVYFGLYSTKNNQNSETTAYFDWFNYVV